MEKKQKTKDNLQVELTELRKQVTQFEKLQAERTKAMEALLESESRFRTIFENAGIPLLTIYADVVDAREWDDEKIKSQVSNFIEARLLTI